MKSLRVSLFAAAAVVAALSAVSVQAEDRKDDFVLPSVPQVVSSAKTAVREQKAPEPAGVALAAQSGELERRIVVFDKTATHQVRLNAVSNLGGVPTHDLWLINAVAVVAPKAKLAAMDAKLKNTPGVLRVERDFEQNWLVAAPAALPPAARALPPALKAEAEPAPEPQGQQVPWGIERVNAKGAWSVTRGAGAKVAVVDTGIDFDHSDLKVAGGFNAIDNAKSFKDDNGHGTHVSGTIAAQNDDKGVVGIAPEVSLYGVKVLNADGSGTFADVIAGIQWTVEHRMDVANFSLGASQGTDALKDAVKAASDGGVAIIAAAGNSGGAVGYPAAYPECIAVAASDSSDKVASFSSRGPEVAIIAPGVAVYSTYMGGGYQKLSGTSMATPHVAGLAALAVASRGLHGQAAIRQALVEAAQKLPNAPATEQGAGMVDAGRLVRH